MGPVEHSIDGQIRATVKKSSGGAADPMALEMNANG